MVLTREYRIAMPITVEEVSAIVNFSYQNEFRKSNLPHLFFFQYRIGQLYMIARHSLEQSVDGEGVEVMENKDIEDPVHGKGQFTEKRIHLSR